MKGNKTARIATVLGALIISTVALMATLAAPAAANPGYGYGYGYVGCDYGYEMALHLDAGEVCATPPVIDGNHVVNGVSAGIYPPAPGQPLAENVFMDTNLPPCYQVAPQWACTLPWYRPGQPPSWRPMSMSQQYPYQY